MKTRAVVLLLASIVSVCQCVDFIDTFTEHLAVCYNTTQFRDHWTYPAQSLDNLIAIIEKIEDSRTLEDRPDVTARFILKRFRIDGIIYNEGDRDTGPYFETDSREAKRGVLISKLLPYSTSVDKITFLTDEEKCALHWMVSHSVNTTVLPEEHSDPYWRPTPRPLYNRRRRQSEPQKRPHSHYPRESGIIYTSSGDAIAAGSVLAGISMISDTSSDVLLRDIIPHSELSTQELRINRFHAVSYGINLALPVIDNTAKPLLGPNGFWNGTICPTEYILNREATSATDAVVLGSFDGYFIVKALEANQGGRSIKLSQLLRMYYETGFPEDRNTRSCNRIAKIQQLLSTGTSNPARGDIQRELATAIILLANDYTKGPKRMDVADPAAKRVLDGLQKNYTSTSHPIRCPDLTAVPEAHPTVDLYVVLERRFLQSRVQYEDIGILIANVADLLDISENASHIGIYIDDQKLFSSFFPLNDTVNEARWKCNVTRYDPDLHYIGGGRGDDSVHTVRALKEMFLELKTAERNRRVTLTPTRVVLFVRTTSVSRPDDIVWEMELFRKDHPEIKILGAGRSHNDLRPYVPENRDFITIQSGVYQDLTAQDIYKKHLQKFGATIYIPTCASGDRLSYDATPFLPPFARQYHEIPSQMFNLSTDFKIEIRAQGIALKVCWSRSDDIFGYPTPPSAKCEEAATSGSPVSVYFGDPCSSYSAGSCPSIFFLVSRKDLTETTFVPCYSATGKLCRTYEHSPYTIKMDNGRCSGCSFTLAINLLAACLVASLIGKLL